jgi:hypothetical protein
VGLSIRELRSDATASLHSYLKRHPRLRRAALTGVRASGRLIRRLQSPRRPGPTPSERVESTPDWVRSWNALGTGVAECLPAHPGEVVENRLPRSLNEIDWHYRAMSRVEVPASLVAVIPGGRAVGEHGVVVSPDNKILYDLSRPVGSIVPRLEGHYSEIPGGDEFWKDAALSPRRIKGTLAVLTAFHGRGYFHWMWDVLPRLAVLEQAGVDLGTIDRFLVPGYFAGYQIESLSAIGIGRDRVISSLADRHIVADTLVVPSLARAGGVVPSWSPPFIRRSFPPSPPAGDTPRRIYVPRKATDHGLLAGEAELVERLVKLGFRSLPMEALTLNEKAWVLSHAEVLLGPGGAGLTNVAFCNPGTKVVELRVQPYPQLEAWDIGNRVGCEYFFVGSPQRQDGTWAVATGQVRTEDILATLEMAGIG